MLRLSLTLSLLGSAAWADAPKVVTDIAPVTSLVAQVMKGVGEPFQLLPAGSNPHDHALRPSEAQALDQANVVFWIGDALSPNLDKAVDTLAGDATVVSLFDAEGTLHLASRDSVIFEAHDDHDDHNEEHHDEEHGDDHREDDEHHEAGHGHDHGADDPHVWLDPENAKIWLGVMAETLATQDTANADVYRANAAEGQAMVDQASETARDLLSAAEGQTFAVLHDAFQYFESRFELTALGALSDSDATSPSPARMAALRDAITEAGVTCVIAEPQFDPRLIEAMGGTLSVTEVDPLGAELAAGPGLYPELVVETARRIAGCGQ